MIGAPQDSDPDAKTSPARAGIVAVVGRANVGKSSLVNTILGEKISIVTPVAQTTRNVIRGILTEPRGQLVFHDTPGVHKAASDLGRIMNRVARTSVEGADVVLLVVNAAEPPRDEDRGWMSRLRRDGIPIVVALNKTDLGGAGRAALRGAWDTAGQDAASPSPAPVPSPEPRWMEVSALTGDGVTELVSALFELVPEGPQLFPEDVLTDFPRKLAIADVIREKLFGSLREELPHTVAVWVEDLRESEAGWRVKAQVYVMKHSQKGIVIGEKGRLLRKVRRSAEAELAAIYEKPVALELWVKVEPKWDRNFWLLKKFGYVP